MRKETENQIPSSVMEGMTSIRAILSATCKGASRIEKILFDQEKIKKIGKEVAWLRHRGEELGFAVEGSTAEEMEKYTTGNTHGGIIAFVSPREIAQLKDSTDDIKPDGFYVMIEGIEDPYNFGYALRSLYAFGVDGIILPMRNWMTAAGVVARASAGASESVELFMATPEEAVEIFHQKGYTVVCAEENAPVALGEAPLPLPIFAVVGGEKRGMSQAVKAGADLTVRIDYGREFKASLSAASAATVFGYEIARQNPKK